MCCANCLRRMARVYDSWYQAWVWRCLECKITKGPEPSEAQLSLEHEKGW